MLKHLHIRHYALIESLDIDFERGFSVITGETGAGKSILLGAIGQLLGQRSDARAIQTGASKCVVEAEFALKGFGLETFFEAQGFDFEDQTCIVRRELTAAGKSRAFINDTPATVAQLKALGAQIIDIHSQHQNLLLANADFQLDVLDCLGADARIVLDQYATTFAVYTQQRNALASLKSRLEKNRANREYIQFLLAQLEEFSPQIGEDGALDEEIRTLSHAEDIKEALFETSQLLNGESQGALKALGQTRQIVRNVARHYGQANEWASRLEEAYIEMKDIAAEIEDATESIVYDPQRLEQLHARQNQLQTLEKKHHVQSSAELLALKENLRNQLDEIDCGEDEIAHLQKQLDQTTQQLHVDAAAITQMRTASAHYLQDEMCAMLAPLGMPNARLEVVITPIEKPNAKGMDSATFLFSANKNGAPRPIADVASGGEIARVMLTLKAILSQVKQLPTVVFDEIDTGVSGHIAECMAHMMKRMASAGNAQVISITHLPQIAAIGDNHYRVYKEDSQEQSHSHIVRLSDTERIEEIAHMLSGAEVTQAAIDNAKQLLKR